MSIMWWFRIPLYQTNRCKNGSRFANVKWKKKNDILEALDLTERTLSYKVNGRDFGVAFKILNKPHID